MSYIALCVCLQIMSAYVLRDTTTFYKNQKPKTKRILVNIVWQLKQGVYDKMFIIPLAIPTIIIAYVLVAHIFGFVSRLHLPSSSSSITY
jgi:hypothetical protein